MINFWIFSLRIVFPWIHSVEFGRSGELLFAGGHGLGRDGQKDVWVWGSIPVGLDERFCVIDSQLETGFGGETHLDGRIYRECEDDSSFFNFGEVDLRLLAVVQDDVYPCLVAIPAGVHSDREVAEDGVGDFEITGYLAG